MALHTEFEIDAATAAGAALDRPTVVADSRPEVVEPATPGTQMRVRKRDGSLEPVNLDKIVKAISPRTVGRLLQTGRPAAAQEPLLAQR